MWFRAIESLLQTELRHRIENEMESSREKRKGEGKEKDSRNDEKE